MTRDGRFGDRPIKADYTNFAPRLGVAWSPTDKLGRSCGCGTVLRPGHRQHRLRQEPEPERPADRAIHLNQPDFHLAGSVQFRRIDPCNTPAGIVCVVRPLVLTDQIDRKTPSVDQYDSDRRTAAQRQHGARGRVTSRPRGTICSGGSISQTSRCLAPRLPPRPFAVSGVRLVPGRGQCRLLALQFARHEADPPLLRRADGAGRLYVLEIDRQRQRHPNARVPTR